MGICCCRGAVFGNMEGHSIPRTFERRVKFLFIMRIFIEKFKRHVREASGKVQLSPQRPLLGKLEVVGLPGILRKRNSRAPDMEHL